MVYMMSRTFGSGDQAPCDFRSVPLHQVVAVGPCDGVEFRALDFLDPPREYYERVGRRLDVILHKLSDDIMFR